MWAEETQLWMTSDYGKVVGCITEEHLWNKLLYGKAHCGNDFAQTTSAIEQDFPDGREI